MEGDGQISIPELLQSTVLQVQNPNRQPTQTLKATLANPTIRVLNLRNLFEYLEILHLRRQQNT